jgi:hypothetical protein
MSSRSSRAEIGVSKLAPHDLRRYTESRTMPNEVTGRAQQRFLALHDSA